MIRNGDALMRRFFRLDDDVAAGLMNLPILPSAAENTGEALARNIARQLHAMDKTSSLTR